VRIDRKKAGELSGRGWGAHWGPKKIFTVLAFLLQKELYFWPETGGGRGTWGLKK